MYFPSVIFVMLCCFLCVFECLCGYRQSTILLNVWQTYLRRHLDLFPHLQIQPVNVNDLHAFDAQASFVHVAPCYFFFFFLREQLQMCRGSRQIGCSVVKVTESSAHELSAQ